MAYTEYHYVMLGVLWKKLLRTKLKEKVDAKLNVDLKTPGTKVIEATVVVVLMGDFPTELDF